MEDTAATGLEITIADAGVLLVELEKFRAGQEPEGLRLRSEALALGQEARRLHRAGALGDATAVSLGHDADALVRALRGALAAVRGSTDFRAATVAHENGDQATLARLLPRLFEGLEYVAAPPPLFRAVSWLRRNRPRPAADVVLDVTRLRDTGVSAEGDAQAPGTDPALPAVALRVDPPSEPILLRFLAETLPPAVFRLRDTGEYLLHVPLLRAPFEVVLPETLDPDDVGEISLDHARYRAALVELLAPTGLPVLSA